MIALLLAAAAAMGPADYEVRIEGYSGPGCHVDRRFEFRRGQAGWSVERTEYKQFICKGYIHQWIAPGSCPALGKVVAAFPAALAGLGEPNRLVFDAPTLTVSGGGQSRSDILGPLAGWWYASERALEPCWRRAQTG